MYKDRATAAVCVSVLLHAYRIYRVDDQKQQKAARIGKKKGTYYALYSRLSRRSQFPRARLDPTCTTMTSPISHARLANRTNKEGNGMETRTGAGRRRGTGPEKHAITTISCTVWQWNGMESRFSEQLRAIKRKQSTCSLTMEHNENTIFRAIDSNYEQFECLIKRYNDG